ncbi:MAG: 4Fe-4S binding protein [Nitrosomonadales bacterium]|nr:4Fe-4S binding protein [Nitrosomonadales bacterium]
MFVLIPAFGLFRIDLVAGNFVVLGRQIWWSDINLMLGFGLMLTMLGIMTYSTTGTIWCGWACPQNTLSEWANNMTHKFLGKQANVNVESHGSQVAASKNKALNWIILVSSFLAVSMVLSVIPFFYFFTPGEVWSFITFSSDSSLSQFMHRLYFVCVAAFFLDISGIRYFWCNYACAYRFGQRFFKTKDALHVSYDASRSSACTKCNYCATSCIVGINPTKFAPTDTCINCGECIDACDRLHAKDGSSGLLCFKLAEKDNLAASGDKRGGLLTKVSLWVGLSFLVGCALFVWGIVSYSPYSIVAYRSDKSSGVMVSEYRIQVSNKVYAPAHIELSVKGLPEGGYRLEPADVELEPASRKSAILHVSPDLPKGLHLLTIEARGPDGWTGEFQVEHYSARN